MNNSTIAAIATAPGRGGVGVLRVSGPLVLDIANKILGFSPKPRFAHYTDFLSVDSEILDKGIALYFPNPHSFTGEDILELQAHGGPVILDMLLNEIVSLGANIAKPGEFSERAFLNDKLDLAQAEAIADLIDASSQQAAKQALQSLKGEFSKKINTLVEKLIHLRMYVESAIDFPEEEIDFLTDGKVGTMLEEILQSCKDTLDQAKQGSLIREGMKVVIAGKPNAGKSSLLNTLAEKEVAIVTDIAGTTRDVLREHIHIDGMPLHIIDTAGLRESPDKVEQIGIERAWKEISESDRILLVLDSNDAEQISLENKWFDLFNKPEWINKLTVIYNKIDISSYKCSETPSNYHQIAVSTKSKEGIDKLKRHLLDVMGFNTTAEGGFSARRRHIEALKQARHYIETGKLQLLEHAAGELLAEDLRLAQDHLSEITGEFKADDLLGKIFSSFCIGK